MPSRRSRLSFESVQKKLGADFPAKLVQRTRWLQSSRQGEQTVRLLSYYLEHIAASDPELYSYFLQQFLMTHGIPWPEGVFVRDSRLPGFLPRRGELGAKCAEVYERGTYGWRRTADLLIPTLSRQHPEVAIRNLRRAHALEIRWRSSIRAFLGSVLLFIPDQDEFVAVVENAMRWLIQGGHDPASAVTIASKQRRRAMWGAWSLHGECHSATRLLSAHRDLVLALHPDPRRVRRTLRARNLL